MENLSVFQSIQISEHLLQLTGLGLVSNDMGIVFDTFDFSGGSQGGNKQPPPKIQGTQWKWREQKQKIFPVIKLPKISPPKPPTPR